MNTTRTGNIFLFLFSIILVFNNNLLRSQELNSNLDTLMNYMHSRYNFDGVVLAAKYENIIYNKAFGYANREWNIENTTDTKFRIGSISKQFTAYVIIKLAEENKLSIDDPVSKYLNNFSNIDKKSITIRNLLTHTSGLFNYTSMKELASENIYSHDTILNLIASYPLNFQPGSNYRYSNSNYFVLAYLAETITGKSFEELLKEKIFLKANMNNSGVDHNYKILNKRASAYHESKGKFTNSDYVEMDNTLGGGGLYSTAGDLLNWSVYFRKQLANDSFLKEALIPYELTDNTTSSYSCGWCLLPGEYMHQGHIGGFANEILIDTINNFTVILLSNTDLKQVSAAVKMISVLLQHKQDDLNIFFNKISISELTPYEGTYADRNDTVLIKVENGNMVSYYKQFISAWMPFLKDEFFCLNFDGNIFFNRNNSGKITEIKTLQDYNIKSYKKIK